ncbi:MAG: GNAT family N-acetyltransferase [Egibacteraceae bacterium]
MRRQIHHLDPLAHATGCDDVIRSLPYFFGQPEGVAACAEAVRQQSGWVAEQDGVVTGFLTLERHVPDSAEVTWMAVCQGHRRAGIGRVLIERAIADLAGKGALFMFVFTLGPSFPEQGRADSYEGTRQFYRSMGFVPLRELQLEDWSVPALLLVRRTDHQPDYHKSG